jgi:hypothetical protein
MFTTGHFEEGGDWRLFDENPALGIKRYRLDLGNGQAVMRTEYHHTEELLKANHEQLMDSQGSRWGDGQIVARIPLNVLYNELGDAVREGDEAYVNKWLNNSDHRKFRTREGKL